jgi:hypothetical protein
MISTQKAKLANISQQETIGAQEGASFKGNGK